MFDLDAFGLAGRTRSEDHVREFVRRSGGVLPQFPALPEPYLARQRR